MLTTKRDNLLDVVHNHYVQTSAEYVIREMNSAMVFQDRTSLYDFCIERVKAANDSSRKSEKDLKDVILEFGVYKGGSINYFAKALPNFRLIGFDSFVGLEEAWTGTALGKHSLSVDNHLPKVLNNVELRKGYFIDSLPEYLDETQNLSYSCKLINIDCDTYTPTKFILEQLQHLLKPGLIVIFDEYFNYINWPEHEFKAWRDFTKEQNVDYRYLAYSNTTCVAVEIV